MIDPLSLPGTAARAEASAAQPGEDAARLYGVRVPTGRVRRSSSTALFTRSYHSYFYLNPHVTIGSYRSTKSPSELDSRAHGAHAVQAGDCLNTIKMARAVPSCSATPSRPSAQHPRPASGRTPQRTRIRSGRATSRRSRESMPHGYAPEYNVRSSPSFRGSAAARVGRAPFRQITSPTSDAGGAAYTDSAIDRVIRTPSMELLRS